MRVIGIVGLAHCGSTALSRLMAALPEVASPGEAHWLIDLPHEERRKGLCAVHGKSCRTFYPKFCAMKHYPNTMYQRVLGRYPGRTVLLSSDKSLRNFSRFVYPKQMTSLILYRRPLAQALSLKRAGKLSTDGGIALWRNFYCRALGWSQLYAADTVVVSLERFMESPHKSLHMLGERLGLEVPKKIPKLSEIEYCHLRGNPGAHKSSKLFVDKRWNKAYSEGTKRRVRGNREIRSMLNALDDMAREWSK